MPRRMLLGSLLGALLLNAMGCATVPKVNRLAVGTDIDLSGNWNDVDARNTAEALISECFASAWLPTFSLQHGGRSPAVRVRGVTNRTDEHIDAEVFIKNIERAMVNSGKVQVLAQEGAEMGAMAGEQALASSGRQRLDTPVMGRSETGADLVVAVRLAAVIDQIEGQHVRLYQIDFELISPTTGEKAWIGEHKIKKYVSQNSTRW